jgi:hypothetical protein
MQCVRIKREPVAIYWDGSIRLEVFAEDGEVVRSFASLHLFTTDAPL